VGGMKYIPLIACLLVTGCVDPKPEIKTIYVDKYVYPIVPNNLLKCDPEPVPGKIYTDVALAQFTEAVRVSGADCRRKLDGLRGWVQSWPAR
jgi:hypothetical protein